MKLILLADVHANLPALEAVLAHAEAQGASDMILNLGDFVGYGAFPEEVVNTLFGIGTLSVIGDYDQKVLNRRMIESKWAPIKKPDKRLAFQYAYEQLSANSRARLITLPEARRLILEGVRVLMTHGSPESSTDHISPTTSMGRLYELADLAASDLVLCGNTHRTFTTEAGSTTFINPGSVGRPDDGDPRASYAVLSLAEGAFSVEFFRVPYDIEAAVAAIRAHSLPERFAQMILQGRNYDEVIISS